MDGWTAKQALSLLLLQAQSLITSNGLWIVTSLCFNWKKVREGLKTHLMHYVYFASSCIL